MVLSHSGSAATLPHTLHYMYFNTSIPGDSDRALNTLSTCITEIKQWMGCDKLKLNDENRLPATVNTEIGGLTNLMSRATNYPG